MLKDFNQFIIEARGFSNTAAEYSAITGALINGQIDKYLARDFTKEKMDYFKTFRINDAFLEVSQESSRQFPIDNINVLFRIVPVTPEEFGPYSAYYKNNYNKAKLTGSQNNKVNITIMCKLYVEFDKNGNLDRDLLNSYIEDILQHEFTHALNDYRDPNFLKNYRLGILPDYAASKYDFVKKSQYLKAFLSLLYVLTKEEINAISGERAEFKTKEEFTNYNGTQWAMRGLEFDPEEYYEGIESELRDDEYWEGINTRFGEIFVDLYKSARKSEDMSIDPKIINLEKSATLQDVLNYFEPYIKSRAKELYRRLSRKIVQQGTGKLD